MISLRSHSTESLDIRILHRRGGVRISNNERRNTIGQQGPRRRELRKKSDVRANGFARREVFSRLAWSLEP
jgi:hypothetical protein